MVSAHWESAPLALSSAVAHTPLVYDFSGFAPVYYRFRYPTPDASVLARLVAGVIPDALGLVRDSGRGLGAWVPLMAMYPEADLPVLQLSIPTQVAADRPDVVPCTTIDGWMHGLSRRSFQVA